ncbi:organic cation transporter protein-like protein [Leptotrombidium deliense]|uniref:Organic cation transporter protein-like protein n=1 Tax=Leptotrombidium deliense TaxID=299467 RepID=A0A443RZ34_9ACAR|nr:organic cation transporter protein-like protein [Leptotrombidium deliense]
MLKFCLVLYLNCFTNGFVAYGIGYSIGVFGGNLFLSVFLLTIADTISNFFQIYVLKKWPRLPVLTCSLIINAICCFLLSAVLWFQLSTIYRMIIVMFIHFSANVSFRLAYLLSTEIIPTSMRQLGVGSCTVAIRVGSIMAPFIKEFSAWTHPSVSMGLFGALMVIDAIVVWLLPETKGIEIPDTLYEAANIGKKEKETEC